MTPSEEEDLRTWPRLDPGPKVHLELTRLEIAAVLSLLVDRTFAKEGTQEWEDVITGEVLTLDELLTRFSRL